MQGQLTDPVYLSVTTPPGIKAVAQPDTLYGPDTVLLSLFVTDSTISEGHYPVYIRSTNLVREHVDTLELEVIPGYQGFMDHTLARNYRDSALQFIMHEYPGIIYDYGDLVSADWTGFYPYPPPDIVSHFVFLHENWRINVLWHVMVPPDDWKKVFIYNNEEEAGWGIRMDSENQPVEIPLEKYYYFFQDTAIVSGNSEISGGDRQPMIVPNPFHRSAEISFRNPDHEPFIFRLFDMNGRLIRQIKGIRNSRFILQRDGLEAGIYCYQLTGGTVYRGRIIVL
jgi:hypothetical protein